jgi:hypothetical protein
MNETFCDVRGCREEAYHEAEKQPCLQSHAIRLQEIRK